MVCHFDFCKINHKLVQNVVQAREKMKKYYFQAFPSAKRFSIDKSGTGIDIFSFLSE